MTVARTGPAPLGLRRFILNLGAFNAAHVGSSAVQFAFGVYLANAIGSADYGRYATVVALVALFGGLLDFGLELIVIRRIARERASAPRYLGALAVLHAMLALIVGLIVAVAALFLGYPSPMLMLIALFYIATAIGSIGTAGVITLQGLEEFVHIGGFSFLLTLGTAGAAMVAVSSGWGLVGVLSAYLIGAVVQAAVFLPLAVRRANGIDLSLDLAFLLGILRDAAPLGLSAVFSTVYLRMDRVILSSLVGVQAVGWYAAAFVLVQGLMDLIWSGFNKTMYPVLSRAAEKPHALASITQLLVVLFAAIFVGASITVSFIAEPIVDLLYPRGDFGAAATALRVLIWLTVPTVLWALYRNLLLVNGQQVAYAVITAVGVAVNLGLNVVLVLTLGWIGAAFAAISTQVVLLVVTYRYATRSTPVSLPIGRLSGVILSAMVYAGLLGVAVASGRIAAWVVPAGGVYVGLLFLFGSLRRRDVGTLRGAVSL